MTKSARFLQKITKNDKKYTFFLRFLQSDLSKRATFEPSTLSEVEGQMRPKPTTLRQTKKPKIYPPRPYGGQTQFPAGYAIKIRLLNYKIQQGKRKKIDEICNNRCILQLSMLYCL